MYFFSDETDSGSIFQYKIADPASIWLKFGGSSGDLVEHLGSGEFLPFSGLLTQGCFDLNPLLIYIAQLKTFHYNGGSRLIIDMIVVMGMSSDLWAENK